MSLMRAHGQFEIHREGDVIISRLIGAWNAEALQAYQSQYHDWVDAVGGKPWAKLVDLRGWETSPMELIEPYQQFQRRCVEQGCRAIGFVSGLQLHHYLVEQTEFACPVLIDGDETIVRRWLDQQGFATD